MVPFKNNTPQKRSLAKGSYNGNCGGNGSNPTKARLAVEPRRSLNFLNSIALEPEKLGRLFLNEHFFQKDFCLFFCVVLALFKVVCFFILGLYLCFLLFFALRRQVGDKGKIMRCTLSKE